jgi:outer membrane protein TolC
MFVPFLRRGAFVRAGVLIAAAAALAGPAARLRADETPGALSLSGAVDLARRANPDILAARQEWLMSQAQVRMDATWPDPEIGIEFWGFPRSSLNLGAAPETWYDVAQKIPFPGKLTLRQRAAQHAARREEGRYHAAESDVVAAVKEAYHELLYADRAVRIYEESADVMRRFARIVESKYAIGKTAQSDVLRAQVELSKMQNMALNAAQERETAQARLNSLLNRRPGEPIAPTDLPSRRPLRYSEDELEALALDHRPEVHAAAHHVNHMRAALAAAHADYLPDTTVQFTRRTIDGQPSDNIAMFRMNLPFIWFWRQGAVVKSTRLEMAHAEAMLTSASNQTRYDVKEYLTHVETSLRLVQLYETTVLPQAAQALRVSETAYQSDRLGFLDLLDSERASIQFQLEYQRALADYGRNLAHLERVVGIDLFSTDEKETPHE